MKFPPLQQVTASADDESSSSHDHEALNVEGMVKTDH